MQKRAKLQNELSKKHIIYMIIMVHPQPLFAWHFECYCVEVLGQLGLRHYSSNDSLVQDTAEPDGAWSERALASEHLGS